MALLLSIMMFLAIWHFAYESILMPTIRLGLRYRFFKVRDKLRMLKIQKKNEITEDLFNHLDNFINSSINYLPYLNYSLIIQAKEEFKSNIELQRQVEQKIELMNSCKSIEAKKLYEETIHYSNCAFILNMGSWIIYLLPILLIVYILFKIELLAFGLEKEIKKITFTPENQFDKFVLQ